MADEVEVRRKLWKSVKEGDRLIWNDNGTVRRGEVKYRLRDNLQLLLDGTKMPVRFSNGGPLYDAFVLQMEADYDAARTE